MVWTLILSGNWISSHGERQEACPVATVGAELWDRWTRPSAGLFSLHRHRLLPVPLQSVPSASNLRPFWPARKITEKEVLELFPDIWILFDFFPYLFSTSTRHISIISDQFVSPSTISSHSVWKPLKMYVGIESFSWFEYSSALESAVFYEMEHRDSRFNM